MKRTIALVAMTALLAPMLGASARAGALRPRVYEGMVGDAATTIELRLLKRDDRPLALASVVFGAHVTCDDGAVQDWLVGFGWFGGGPTLPSHTIDLDMVDTSMAIHLHGVIKAVRGEGTIEYTVPGLTVDEQAQLCTTGEHPWSVERTVPVVENPPPPVGIQTFHLVAASGTRVTMTRIR